ncbi:MAG: hypothetical protein WCC32_18845 [Terriglobales bacterium]
MNSQKATYWVVLALAAFGFDSAYQQGAFPTLHRVATCASARLVGLGVNAERTVAMARMTIGRSFLFPANLFPSNLTPLRSGHIPASFGAEQLADARQLAHDQVEMARELTQDRAEMVRDQARAQAELMRAQMRLQETELRRAGRVIRMVPQIHISDAMPVMSIEPATCTKSVVRVSLADSPDDDADSR